jgi:CheY-like chemotaxis protein
MGATTPHPVPPPARTVLVVDDVSDARDVLARLLRFGGYKSVTAEDGVAALAAVESDAPDLVLLDLMMPQMNGVEVLRRLREGDRYKDLPVILFTAVGEGGLIDEAYRLGIRELIVKGGVAGRALLDRVAQHLPPQ